MVESVGRVATDQPARYVKQLVSHLGHKRSTRLDDDGVGIVDFDTGRCTLTAEPGGIVLAASAADAETLERIVDVVTRHLERFGTREELRVIWSTRDPA
jgi:hypothetical protein